ncbi:MAG: recombinase family protein [Patescibacteria group bacterium]
MQERQCLAQIVANENKGWSVENTTIYRDEGHSGVSEWYERPGLSQLRADAIAGKIDVLLVWRIDRLFRKVDYLLSFIQEMESIGVNFASKDESIDIASPT